MLSKILSFLMRCISIACIGWLAGAGSYGILGVGSNSSELIASIVWIVGGITSIVKFNIPYDFLKDFESAVFNRIGNVKKQEIENEMLRVKGLLDSKILTQDEYNEKMKSLKEKYFSLI